MSFQQGLSGLNAASRNLDVIGNNIANSGTVGAKASRAEFADLYANSVNGAGSARVGIGVVVADVSQQFNQGNITSTDNPLDIAINGQGFFRMSDDNGISYSRNGQFKLDREGFLVNSAGQRLTGYPANVDGVIIQGAAQDLRLPTGGINPNMSTRIDMEYNLDSRATAPTAAFDRNDPSSYNNATSITLFDSQGRDVAMSAYFRKTAVDNEWEVYGAAGGVDLGLLGTVTFNEDGSLASGGVFNVGIPAAPGATTPFPVEVDLTRGTQYGAAFSVTNLSQDGYAAGRLTGLSISPEGIILGRYSNGQTQAAGQVALANFRNPQGLQPLGGNAWAETFASGQPLIGTPTQGNLGSLQAGALEDSNVDLTAELVNMITAQRTYQANAQTIRTQDQVMQTLVNLR